VFALALLAIAVMSAGCGDDATGDPGVAEPDLRPRLIVTAAGDGLSAAVGERGEGDPAVSADPARLPSGSVMAIRVEGPDGRRVIGVLTPPGSPPVDLADRDATTPSPLVDTGTQEPGDEVTVVLTAPGTLELYDADRPASRLGVEVTAR
jgi:hypothetical protein